MRKSTTYFRSSKLMFILNKIASVVFFVSIAGELSADHLPSNNNIIFPQNMCLMESVSTVQTKNSRKITGTIVDENGDPMIGVNIKIQGTSQGTTTDFDGFFALTVPSSSVVLTITYIGYKEEVITLGKSDVLRIKMKEDSKRLGELVVTAMGIERKAENLTYTTQTVGGNELTRAKEANLINSLQGKSAGLTITPNSGGAGSASKILLRGNASMMGNNSPLIVVDGVPMSNGISGATGVDGGAALAYSGSGEGSDALSKLNPDDIASITVLKGANSAALYGSAASNGVLMITTKQGMQGTMRIDVSSSSMFETPLILPQFQNNYGGKYTLDPAIMSRDSWGEALSSLTDAALFEAQAKGMYLTRTPFQVDDFYRMGTNFNNTISLSGGSEKMQTYFSYGNTTATGIYPSNSYERHNVTLRESFNFFKNKLKVDVSGSYIYQKVGNRFTGGGNMTGALPSLYIGSRNVDMDWYRNNYQKEGVWKSEPYWVHYSSTDENGNAMSVQRRVVSNLKGPVQLWPYSVTSESNNPWWMTGLNNSYGVDNKLFGSIGLNYQIIPMLSVQARFKYDREMGEGEAKSYANTRVVKSTNDDRGVYNFSSNYRRDIYADGILTFDKEFGDFRVGANVGASLSDTKANTHNVNSAASSMRAPYFDQENFSVNYFDFSGLALGSAGGAPYSNWERGLFFTGQLGYKDVANLEASYREDWYRAFTQFRDFKMKQHYGYFSFGGNVILNRLFEITPDYVDMLKFRASYSEVGNSIPNSLWLNTVRIDGGTGGATISNYVTMGDLKPENTASTELGLDLTAFNNTLNVDLTYYHALMRNQFMTTAGTAGKVLIMNAGRVLNQGVEFSASYNWNISRKFVWRTGLNFSYNDNKILTAAYDKNGNEVKREIAFSGDGAPTGSGIKVRFEKGGSYGDIYVNEFRKNSDGSIRVDPNGNPMYNQSNWTKKIGNMNSKINIGWNNTFSYKDLSLYFLIDGRIGGKVISFTEAFLDKAGQSERSGLARDHAIANDLYYNGDRSNPAMALPESTNGQMVSVKGYYEAIGGNCGSDYVYDATNFRLRELSLGYTIRNLLGEHKNLTVSATARNLFFIYKNSPVDPDASISASNALSGVDIFALPTTRSYGLTLKATF